MLYHNGLVLTGIRHVYVIWYGCWQNNCGLMGDPNLEKFGGANVFQIGSDGNNLKRLTAGPTFDGYPAYAPDGSKLAFVSNRDGNPEIYVRSLR